MDKIKRYAHGGNIHEITRGKKQKYIDFSASINPLNIPCRIKRELFNKFSQIKHYPDIESFDLHERIAKYWKINPENILVTNGSIEGIYLITQTYLPKHACVPVPSFTEYEKAARIFNSRVYMPHLRESNNFNLDIKKLPETDMLVIGNPNNPTGNYLITEPDLIKKMPFKKIVIDEAFMDFEEKKHQPSLIRYALGDKKIIVLRTFTKFFALPGLRIGYIIAHKDTIKQLRRNQIPWSINFLAQTAAEIILDDTAFINRTLREIKKEKNFIIQQFRGIKKIRLFPSSANFFLLKINDKKISSVFLRGALLKQSIIIRDCSNFRGLNNKYIRIAVRSRKENLKLIQAIKKEVS